MPSITMLNETGDVTISWNDSQDKKMRKLIQRKLDKGHDFFVIETDFISIMKNRNQLTSISESDKDIFFLNEDEKELLGNSDDILVGGGPPVEIFMNGQTRNINTIMNSDTLIMRPIMKG